MLVEVADAEYMVRVVDTVAYSCNTDISTLSWRSHLSLPAVVIAVTELMHHLRFNGCLWFIYLLKCVKYTFKLNIPLICFLTHRKIHFHKLSKPLVQFDLMATQAHIEERTVNKQLHIQIILFSYVIVWSHLLPTVDMRKSKLSGSTSCL